MSGRASRGSVPAELRPAAGYASTFTLRVDGARFAPEWWARAAMGAPPLVLRWVIALGWRYGLGLRLGSSRSPDRVLGWRIDSADGRRIVLAARSRWLESRNVFTADVDTVSWTTVVEPRHVVGRVLWAVAGPIHELSVPWLLGRAARRAG